MTSPDSFFQDSGANRMSVDWVVIDSDTVSFGGRMIKRKKKEVYE